MKRTLAAMITIVAFGSTGCAREQVYGYCGEGDTCLYEAERTVVVRTYSGFIEPGASAPVDAKAAGGGPDAAATGITTASATTADVVTISN